MSVVEVSGHITLGDESNALRETLRDLMSAGHAKILVNLREVSYIDSAGIGELVSAFKAVTHRGGQLKLYGLSAEIENRLLSYTFFETYHDETAAICSFA